MNWFLIKLLLAFAFLVVPGFSLRENLKQYPVLTYLALIVGVSLFALTVFSYFENDDGSARLRSDIKELRALLEQSKNHEPISRTNDLEQDVKLIKSRVTEFTKLTTFRDCESCPEMVVLPGQNLAIGKYEVTQDQWQALMGSNPSYFSSCGGDCPVEVVNWYEVQEFIKKLNSRTGEYYRLPSEKQWKRACLAGKQTNYCGSNNLSDVGWYKDNSKGKTHPVGQLQANAWGIYDMSGNVYEWVEDHVLYDPLSRVLLGGNWNKSESYSRATARTFKYASWYDIGGFRLTRNISIEKYKKKMTIHNFLSVLFNREN